MDKLAQLSDIRAQVRKTTRQAGGCNREVTKETLAGRDPSARKQKRRHSAARKHGSNSVNVTNRIQNSDGDVAAPGGSG